MKPFQLVFLFIPLLMLACVSESAADPVSDSSVSSAISDDAFERHVEDLRTWIPKGFTVVVEKPFVVIGNEPKKKVERRARETVRYTVGRLKADFFSEDPGSIIDIWLFRDAPSYRRYSRELFGYVPDTPYGFYMASENALVMNIATGAGTLNHEIVHPFMATNFPSCPAWFNEGLGSLYECSTTRDGHIWGMTNWRVPGLQQAIRKGDVPPFEELMSYDENQFYNYDMGTNYAQSRYLLQFIQDKGLLVTYYHRFVANQKRDPSGFETFKEVLGITDMDAFRAEWEKWVLALRRSH